MKRADPNHCCATCAFSTPGIGVMIECHRYPGIVPKHGGDWCGEYQADDALISERLAAKKPKAV